MTRRRRSLSSDEIRLWAHVARHVTPLPGRAPVPEPEPAVAPAPAPVEIESPPARRGPTAAPYRPAPPPKPALTPLAGLERRERTALRRGTRDVDAVLDLHGMHQAEAHLALTAFLHQSQRLGRTLVLVVTGKGGSGASRGLFDERGVLRRVVPQWLRLPDVRPLVVGFDEASPQHGGSGAIYVRLRRGRSA